MFQVSVPPHCHSEMERLVKREGIEYNVTIHDLEQLIREERKYRYYIHSFHWHSQEWSPEIYHNLEEIEGRLESLLSQHSNLLSRQHLGVTAQGRNIDAYRVFLEAGQRSAGVQGGPNMAYHLAAQALLAGPMRLAAWGMQQYFQYVVRDCHRRRKEGAEEKQKTH